MQPTATRLTLDIPADLHRLLAQQAAREGVSVDALVLETLWHDLTDAPSQRQPNAETLATFARTDRGEDLYAYTSFEAFLDDLKNV